MRSFLAFLKKEAVELYRSGRAILLLILFVALGIMNPAVAKLTPWMLQMFADSMAESGMTVTAVEVNALTSWTQFFKNIPIALIVVIFMYAGTLAQEASSGRLIPLLTKGLSRRKVVLAKLTVVLFIWTVGYFMTYFITYLYNAYFWDNSIATGLLPAVIHWWLFGLFAICVMLLFSALAKSYVGVLLSTGATVLVSYLLGMIPKLKCAVPSSLMNSASLLTGIQDSLDYAAAIWITVVLSLFSIASAVIVFDKRQL
ncbi:MAG: ABC transporter permease [Ruminococcaceae bacterium]|nr:ABC transporter permease [Oscillospiraceae bacterium]